MNRKQLKLLHILISFKSNIRSFTDMSLARHMFVFTLHCFDSVWHFSDDATDVFPKELGLEMNEIVDLLFHEELFDIAIELKMKGIYMFKVIKDWNHPLNEGGTSKMGNVKAVYSDLVLAFGEPIDSDGYKVSGEWLFINEESGEVFTVYDWKSTSLYDDSYVSVKEFRANPEPQVFNIGGNHKGSVETFARLLKRQIEYVKLDKPFREIVLLEQPDNSRDITVEE